MDKYFIPVSFLQSNQVVSEAKIQNAIEFLLFFVLVSIIICIWVAKSFLPDTDVKEEQKLIDEEIKNKA